MPAPSESLATLRPDLGGSMEEFDLAADRQGFNLALFSVFETRNACEIFLRHPEYQRVWGEELAPVVDRQLMAQGEGDGA